MRKILNGVLVIVFSFMMLFQNSIVSNAAEYSRVLIDSYEIVDGSFTPGETVTLSIKFVNPNTRYDAYNIVFSYATEPSNVLPVYGESNQVYIGRINAEGEAVIEIKLAIPENISGSEMIMGYYVSYGDRTYSTYEYSGKIAAPLNSSCQLEAKDVFVAESCVAGDNSLLSLTYSNVGMQVLSDVKLHVEYDGKEESVELGRLLAGESEKTEYYLVFDNIGEQEIVLQMSYVDQDGIPYFTEEYVFSTEVVEEADNFQSVMEMSNPEGMGSLYITETQICNMAAFLALALIVGLILFGRKKKFVR